MQFVLSRASVGASPASLQRRRPSRRSVCRAQPGGRGKEELSPGAGLPTAEEQAEAAFRDILEFSKEHGPQTEATRQDMEEVRNIAAGDSDESWKNAKSKGFFGDVAALFGALSGGAHIVRQKDGRI